MGANEFEKVALQAVDRFEQLDKWSDEHLDSAITTRNILENTFHLVEVNWEKTQTAADALRDKLTDQHAARAEAFQQLHEELQEILQILTDLQAAAQQQMTDAKSHLELFTDTLDQFDQKLEVDQAAAAQNHSEAIEEITQMTTAVDQLTYKAANYLEEAGTHMEQDIQHVQAQGTALEELLTQHTSTAAQHVEGFVEHLAELTTRASNAVDEAIEQENKVFDEFWDDVKQLVLEQNGEHLDVGIEAWQEEASSLADDINTKRESFEDLNDALNADMDTANGTLKTAVRVLDELQQTLEKFN
ncbi:MAG: hypothetical protein ACR2IE_07125 [Candidatus Sumerlaeaceae bacterium]